MAFFGLFGEVPVEGRGRGKLDHEPRAGQLDRAGLVQNRARRDGAFGDRWQDCLLPELLQLLQLERRAVVRLLLGGGGVGRGAEGLGLVRRRGRRRSLGCGVVGLARAGLQLLQPVGERLAREVRSGTCDLDERELEREARVASLASVVYRQSEEIHEP